MYHNRVEAVGGGRSFYLITNRVMGGSYIFSDVEKEKLRRLLPEGQERLSYVVWD